MRTKSQVEITGPGATPSPGSPAAGNGVASSAGNAAGACAAAGSAAYAQAANAGRQSRSRGANTHPNRDRSLFSVPSQ